MIPKKSAGKLTKTTPFSQLTSDTCDLQPKITPGPYTLEAFQSQQKEPGTMLNDIVLEAMTKFQLSFNKILPEPFQTNSELMRYHPVSNGMKTWNLILKNTDTWYDFSFVINFRP